jgi:D-alanyl-D-alanine dipeptidase
MKKILLLLAITLIQVEAQTVNTKQLIIVSTQNWKASSGLLQRYAKTAKGWHKVGKDIAVKLGRNGLGWGRGLHTIPKNAKIIKKEGDGKAPAGIFTLKNAFGYAPFKTNYPYKVYTRQDHCVDDVRSKYYNKIVESTRIKQDYQSKEYMKFPKNYYKYGILVNHNHINEKGAKKGAGSCIFIHIKSIPTAGCTVMKEKEMKTIIQWLNPKHQPLLIQGTVAVVNALFKTIR